MFATIRVLAAGVFTALSLITLSGCYEEVNSTPPSQAKSVPAKEGPITSSANQGGGAALGGAKRTATKTVDDAQQASQRVADQANDPGGK